MYCLFVARTMTSFYIKLSSSIDVFLWIWWKNFMQVANISRWLCSLSAEFVICAVVVVTRIDSPYLHWMENSPLHQANFLSFCEQNCSRNGSTTMEDAVEFVHTSHIFSPLPEKSQPKSWKVSICLTKKLFASVKKLAKVRSKVIACSL